MESVRTRNYDSNSYVWKLPDGTYHREDGLAVEWDNGGEEWLVNDMYHRLDGPAMNVTNYKEWYIKGYCVSDILEPWAKEMAIDLDNLSEEDKFLIAMVWGDYDGE